MGADKGKKQKTGELEGANNGAEVIDRELVVSIEKLQQVQDELEKINEEASEKVLEVEQKYNEIRKPIYDRRNDVIKSIPDFWLTAFMSHPALCDMLNEEDQKIFKHLSNLEVEDFKDVKSGYSISFEFNPNPYFEDSKLTKTFAFQEDGMTKVTATSIKWKEGAGISNGVPEDAKGNKRPLVDESFFAWFSNAEYKGDIFGIVDEVADVIKDDLWPNPITYFNNDGDEEEFPGIDDDEDDDDAEEHGDDDSEDEGEQDNEDNRGED
ncbi:NAP1-related protein 2-like [Andrographis paniculata]|uniref:NAP1-related protein 2-like n=1 Tax=Andrographis paniculata TaxID=175694 RepID=UPI0021E87996|nr:NAP1-related protein 2-like [Andrographis paniculata]